MTIGLMGADIRFPVLGFPVDGDPMPFQAIGLLRGKTGWLSERGRHLGFEIVDAAGRSWTVTGVVERAPAARKWWQFGRAKDDDAPAEVMLTPGPARSFEDARARILAFADGLFEADDDDALAARSAETMDALATAAFELMVRAQGRRLLRGDDGIAVRSQEEVVTRALVLSAVVLAVHGADRDPLLDWLVEEQLADLTPSESDLFIVDTLPDEQRYRSAIEIERLAALLWALGLYDLPVSQEPTEIEADLPAIVSMMPPGGNRTAEEIRASTLRPAKEIAALAERQTALMRAAARMLAQNDEDEGQALIHYVAEGRFIALQWVINPDRIDWS